MCVVVGKVIESVTSRSWEDNIRSTTFEPLGMGDSFLTYDEFMATFPEKSLGYDVDGVSPVPHMNVDNVGPAGSISATPTDFMKWLKLWVDTGKSFDEGLLTDKEYGAYAMPRSASMVGSSEFKYIGLSSSDLTSESLALIGYYTCDQTASSLFPHLIEYFEVCDMVGERSYLVPDFDDRSCIMRASVALVNACVPTRLADLTDPSSPQHSVGEVRWREAHLPLTARPLGCPYLVKSSARGHVLSQTAGLRTTHMLHIYIAGS